MRVIFGLLIGTLFGLGLVISGMMNPQKVIGFLNVMGHWDPTLLYVMGAALITTLIGYRIVFAAGRPALDFQFNLPTRREIGPKLMGGAMFFGVGWGLTGVCPGPALTAMGTGETEAILFGASMIAGIALYRISNATR